MKWLIVLNERLKRYLEKLKNVVDQLKRLGGGMRRFKYRSLPECRNNIAYEN